MSNQSQKIIELVASAAVEAAKILIENGYSREQANEAVRQSVKRLIGS